MFHANIWKPALDQFVGGVEHYAWFLHYVCYIPGRKLQIQGTLGILRDTDGSEICPNKSKISIGVHLHVHMQISTPLHNIVHMHMQICV